MYDVLRLRYNDVTLKVTSKVHKRSKKMDESSGELSDVSDQLSDITEIISHVGTDESDVDAEEDIQPAPWKECQSMVFCHRHRNFPVERGRFRGKHWTHGI